MRQIDTKKLLLGFIVILLPMISISTSVYLFLENREVKGVSIKKEVPNRLVPYIANIPPIMAYIGEEYIFVPRIVAEEGSSISLVIEEGPQWLSVGDSNILSGIPSDPGTVKLVLRVSDGYNSSTLVEYIIVQENEEGFINNN